MIAIYNAVFLLFLQLVSTEEKVTAYSFKEFPYKENPKNEALFREYEETCSQGCSGKTGVSKILCTRQCISASCYKDLYANDLYKKPPGLPDVRSKDRIAKIITRKMFPHPGINRRDNHHRRNNRIEN